MSGIPLDDELTAIEESIRADLPRVDLHRLWAECNAYAQIQLSVEALATGMSWMDIVADKTADYERSTGSLHPGPYQYEVLDSIVTSASKLALTRRTHADAEAIGLRIAWLARCLDATERPALLSLGAQRDYLHHRLAMLGLLERFNVGEITAADKARFEESVEYLDRFDDALYEKMMVHNTGQDPRRMGELYAGLRYGRVG